MDWDRIEGKLEAKARSKRVGGELTDDNLDVIDGRREQLEGKLQERYGFRGFKNTSGIVLRCVNTGG
jgi:uncharacterized protein YjbJ (UPF0337 family)